MANWTTPPTVTHMPDGNHVLNLTGTIVLVKEVIKDAKPHLKPRMEAFLRHLESQLTNLTLVKGESK
jgi:hypothetical protein